MTSTVLFAEVHRDEIPGSPGAGHSSPDTREVRPGDGPGRSPAGGRWNVGLLRGVRVLAVDDYPDTLDLLRIILESAGAVVEAASSAEEALAKVDPFEPHLVLTDLSMPGRDGYWLLAEVRRVASGRSLPVVACTAFGQQHPAERVLAAGFAAHLRKPVDPVALCQTLRRVLDQPAA